VGGAVAEKGSQDEGHGDDPEVAEARRVRRWEFRGHKGKRSRDSLAWLVWTDDCAVAAAGNFDEERIGLTFAGVVLEKARAKTSGFDANGIVHGRIVGSITVEDVDSDAVLLEGLGGVVDAVLDDIAEEELAAVCAGEDARVGDTLELSTYWTVLQRSGFRHTIHICLHSR